MKKRIIFFSLSLIFYSNLFAQSYNAKDLVNSKYYEELEKTGMVKIIHEEGKDDLLILPETKYSEKIKGNRIAKGKKNFPFVFEGLFLLDKQTLLKNSNSNDDKIDIEDVSRIFRSISKMQGMKYISSTRGKEKVLYEKAYTIEGPNSKEPIPDKNTGNADGKVIYCLQDDASFGVCRYKLNYSQSENLLYATFTSTDDMGLGPITAIEAGNLRINVLAIDCGDSILLWLCTDANCKKLIGIKDQVTDSMSCRMDAIYNWFIKQF